MVQPPAPPPAATPPYQVPQEPPMYAAPPPRRGVSPVWYFVGCGCLLLILLTAVGAYFGYSTFKAKLASELQKTAPVPTPTVATPGTTAPAPAPPTTSAPTEPAVNEQPGKEAALKVALAGQPGWIGKINYASDDWQRVKVWIGPPNSEYTTALVLQWNGQNNAYTVESSAPIAQYQPPVVVEPQPPVYVEPVRRGNPARPRGGFVVPEGTPGYDNGTPPREPRGRRRGRDLTPEPTPGHD